MKIIIFGNFGRSWDGSLCDEENIAYALEGLGHKIIRAQRGENEPDGTADFVIISQWNGYQAGLTQALSEKYNCPIIYWAFDYQWESHEGWHFDLAKGADLFLSCELAHAHEYINMGANFKWFPQAFAPDFMTEIESKYEKDIDVLFTGTLLPQAVFRRRLITEVDKNFNLTVCSMTGDAWRQEGIKNVLPPAVDDDLSAMISRAKINLSVDMFTGIDGCWSDRNAQIMASGGFCLYKHAPMSVLEFRDGVVYFNTIEDCLDKIKYYLEHETERLSIARRGKELAIKATDRAKQLITLLENYEIH
jgi:hypothetical protein